MTIGVSISSPLWEIHVTGGSFSAPCLWFPGALATPTIAVKMTVCCTKLQKITVVAKMQCIGSCLNHAQKQAVLSKTQACICSMQLIYSLTCQTADSAFTDVCCLILLSVCFGLNHLSLPVIRPLTIFICSPPQLHFHLSTKTFAGNDGIYTKASLTIPTRLLASCCLNVIQH